MYPKTQLSSPDAILWVTTYTLSFIVCRFSSVEGSLIRTPPTLRLRRALAVAADGQLRGAVAVEVADDARADDLARAHGGPDDRRAVGLARADRAADGGAHRGSYVMQGASAVGGAGIPMPTSTMPNSRNARTKFISGPPSMMITRLRTGSL